MGRDRHYYDKNGNYKGHSSDSGPLHPLFLMIFFLILAATFSGC